jgi:hypothetical protein
LARGYSTIPRGSAFEELQLLQQKALRMKLPAVDNPAMRKNKHEKADERKTQKRNHNNQIGAMITKVSS